MSTKTKKEIDFDPYKMLQLEFGCQPSQVDKAYKKMALKWHPDKNPEQKEKAKEMFLKIYKAFEFLKDEVAKLEYDEKIAAKRRRAEFDEARQTQSSAQRKAHLIKLEQVSFPSNIGHFNSFLIKNEAKAAKAGQKRKSEQMADQLLEELRRQGAEMLQRRREEAEQMEMKLKKGKGKTADEIAKNELEQRIAAAQQKEMKQNKQELSNELDDLERQLFGGSVI
jgi:curved DNA-binding protein CbpA